MSPAARPSVGLLGQPVVKVYNSDPQYGDPEDFIFFLPKDGYTPEQLDKKSRDMRKVWLDVQEKRGHRCTTELWMQGPFGPMEEGRIDLSEAEWGNDEFRFTAYFLREPLTWTLDEANYYLTRAREMGITPTEPAHWHKEPEVTRRTSTSNDPFADHAKRA